jgi:hypothetical protein
LRELHGKQQQTTARDHAQQPPAHACLHVGDGGDIESGDGSEVDTARGGGIEYTVDDHAVEVQDGNEAVT